MITRRAALTALAGLAASARSPRAGLSEPPDHHRRALSGRRTGRHHGASDRAIGRRPASASPIAVDNRGGGAGVIGSVAVQHAEPDGHTLVLGTNQTHATNQSLLKNCPYDAVKDFVPVAGIAEIPHVLVVRRGLEATSVGRTGGARQRQSPGALNYASTGVGSASHLAAELFKTRAGVDASAHSVPRRSPDDHRASRRPRST